MAHRLRLTLYDSSSTIIASMQFPTRRISRGRSTSRRFIVGQRAESSNNRSRAYSNYPDSNSETNDQEFAPKEPQPQTQFQSQVPWGGDSHYREVHETNANIRRNEGYGQTGRRPYYRGNNNTYTNPNSRPSFNAVPYAYQTVNPSTGTYTGQRQFDRPMRAPPPDDHRHWQYALRQPPSQNERFIILSYNILADYLARHHRQELYMHIPHYMLDWDWRKQRIMLELGLWSPDIMCLQEVDKFHELQQELKQRGYGGVFKERTGIARDGCAIFWRRSRFELLHEESIEYRKLGLRDNVAQICVLQSKCMGNAQWGTNESENSGQIPGAVNHVVVCNIHVFFNPKRGEVKLGQVRVLLERAHAVSKAWDNAPVVICGDFNSTPKSPLYDFVSKSELDISGLARNQISGQPGSQPNFRSSSSNRDVSELARLAGTILQSAIGNEVVHEDKNTTSSSALRDSMSEENILKVLTDKSVEWRSVQAEKDSLLAGSKKENSLTEAKCITETITDASATMDTKVNYGKDVDESYVTEEGQYASLNNMKQTSQCLSTEETIKFAVKSEEGSPLAGGSLENSMKSTGYHPVSVEEMVSAVNEREDQARRSLDLCSSECLLTEKETTILSDEVFETDGNLYLHKTVKEDAREEEEDGVYIVSEARKSESTNKCISSVVGSDTPTQLRAELLPEGVESQDGSVSAENNIEASSGIMSKEGENDTGNFSGMERFDDIASGEVFLLNAQNADAGFLDEQIVKQSDPSPVFPFESAGLNCGEVSSMSLSGKSFVSEEQEGNVFSLDEIIAKSLVFDTDEMNTAICEPDRGQESTNQPSELRLASASDSNTHVDASIVQYDPYSWSPMEVEAATGNADCCSIIHNMRLRSTYTEVEDYAGTKRPDGEPLVTSYHRRFMGTVDYIWRTEGLQTVKVLDTLQIHILQRTRGFPTKKWGSDHLALACQLAFTSKSSIDEDR